MLHIVQGRTNTVQTRAQYSLYDHRRKYGCIIQVTVL